jgi:hypothetical protein
MAATIAKMPRVPSAPDHREIELQAIIAVMLKAGKNRDCQFSLSVTNEASG